MEAEDQLATSRLRQVHGAERQVHGAECHTLEGIKAALQVVEAVTRLRDPMAGRGEIIAHIT